MMGESPTTLSLRHIKSRRLNLVAATAALIKLDIAGREVLSKALGVSVPQSWPPDLYGSAAMRFALTQLGNEAEQGWSFWYLVTTNAPNSHPSIDELQDRILLSADILLNAGRNKNVAMNCKYCTNATPKEVSHV